METKSKQHKAIKVRIYPTPAQEEAFLRICGCCRLVYNLGLEQRRDFWRQRKALEGKGFSWFSQKAELTALKKDFPFLKEAPSHCLQMALKNLDAAYQRFFKGEAGYPKARKKFAHDRFTFSDPAQFEVDARAGVLRLPKFNGSKRKDDAGPLRAVFHRPLGGDVRSITVSRAGRHWYASLNIIEEVAAPRPRAITPARTPARTIGVDRGVMVPFATSSGLFLGHTTEGTRERERAKRLARNLARCQKGSKNRAKARALLADHTSKMARRRADMIHQASSAIVKNHDVVAIEALRTVSMTASAAGTPQKPGKRVAQKSGLNRAILDKGWGMFKDQLAYKLAWKGGRLVEVPAAYTSQECGACGFVHQKNRHGQAFACLSCGHKAHADTNAARVVKKRALKQLGLVDVCDPQRTHASQKTNGLPAEEFKPVRQRRQTPLWGV